jgi:hypothetical protein
LVCRALLLKPHATGPENWTLSSSALHLIAELRGTTGRPAQLDNNSHSHSPKGPVSAPIAQPQDERNYLQHIRSRLARVTDVNHDIWTGVSAGNVLPFNLPCEAATLVLKTARKPDVSTTDIIDELVKHKLFNETAKNDNLEHAARFVLECIQLATMIFDPPALQTDASDPSELLERLQTSPNTPLIDMLRASGVEIMAESLQAEKDHWGQQRFLDPRDTILAANLNFDSLCRVAELNIKWVLRVDQHLLLDARTSTLSVFAFPSFCGVCNGNTSMISRYV